MTARALPPLHLVTDDAVLANPRFCKRAWAALTTGGSELALHLRGPALSGRRLFTLAEQILPMVTTAGALLLINDRVDVALACGAHGVQLGARGIPSADARRLLGDRPLLGVSVHSREAAQAAPGADFLLVGTLFASASHPERAGAGTQILQRLADLGVPRVGIGGITPERVGEVRRAGAAGIAVLSGVWEADEPEAAVEGYLTAWKRAA